MASKEDSGGKQDECTNFLRQFRDKDTRQLKKFTATQFMDVWNHYDSDGKLTVVGKHVQRLDIYIYMSCLKSFMDTTV